MKIFLLVAINTWLWLLFSIGFIHIAYSQSQHNLVIPIGHNHVMNTFEFSPDGKYFLTSSMDGIAHIYEANSAKELKKFIGYTANFSPDGKYVVTATGSTVRIYNVFTGAQIKDLREPAEIRYAEFSPDGKYVLTASWGGYAYLYNLISGKKGKVLKGHASSLFSAKFSPDGKYVVTASTDKTARVFKVRTGKQLQVLSGHMDFVENAEFSPDGKYVLTQSRDDFYPDNSARIYDVLSGQELRVLNGKVAKFSPDTKYVVTACKDSTVRIIEMASGLELHILKEQDSKVLSAEFSPCGKYLAIAYQNKTARIYEVVSGKEIYVLRGLEETPAESIKFSPDGNYIGMRSSWEVKIYDLYTGKELQALRRAANKIHTAGFSPDGKFLVATFWHSGTEDYKARIYEVATGRELHILRGHFGRLNAAKFSSDGKYVVTASDDHTSRVYEVLSGKEVRVLRGHASSLWSAEFSPDGKYVMAYGSDSSRLFDVFTGHELGALRGKASKFSPDGDFFLMHNWDSDSSFSTFETEWMMWNGNKTYPSYNAEYSSDGKYVVTASLDWSARIYEASSGKELHILRGHFGDVNSAKFSSDGKYVVTASDDHTARIYELFSGQEVMVLEGHTGPVETAEFSADGKFVLTSSLDRTARIYEVESGRELQVLSWHQDHVSETKFSPDGKYVLTIFNVGALAILWDAVSGLPIYVRYQFGNDNWLVKLPNSPYYMCSKDASKMLHYVTPSLKVIGFEQLDPVYNRPDIVLDSIGHYFENEDQGMIDEYKKMWEKRIERLGLDKEKLGKGEIAVPNAEIVGADKIAYENKEGKVDIEVAAHDPKYILKRFNVYVNEVPLYGSAGLSIDRLNQRNWDTIITIPLSLGENKIQVSVVNELGLENFKYPTYVNYTPVKGKKIIARTHYIGIGVNKFIDNARNLQYCVKDVSDLANAFQGKNNRIKLYTDKNVNRENILSLKKYLADSTTVHDRVIISCSSHGLLDDSLNFYLAMHDVDFKNPMERGLKYEELEGLMDGIPARQKLLLLDACNSGENDRTEIMKRDLEEKKHTIDNAEWIASRGVIVEIVEENVSAFTKMNELFVNVRNNTGSVIISAAGGQQSALEAIKVDGKPIENGAFTYSILECLKQNEGKELKVNALKKYAEKRVEEITNGKQKPTSRQETMEVDWGGEF